MNIETDSQVIARSITQPECFEVVFDRHFGRILEYLRRRLGAELAGDLAAETFERAFRARGRFTARDGSALPWLYGIAANLTRMHHRSEQRRLRAYARVAIQTFEGDPVEDAGLGPALAQALADLSPSLREVLLLHAWGELSHHEIAGALQLSPAAVRTRLHRARSEVARCISTDLEAVLTTSTNRGPTR